MFGLKRKAESLLRGDMYSQGKIVKWKQDQAFGFIQGDDGTKDIFVHVTAFQKRSREPVVGDGVIYKLTLDDQARLRATSVRFQGEGRSFQRKSFKKIFILIVCIVYALMVSALIRSFDLSRYMLGAVFALNIVTYFFYKADKTAARANLWRVSKKTLHLLSLLGGWPGALIAQRTLRHKTSKTQFRVLFYLTVFINAACVFGLLWLKKNNMSGILDGVLLYVRS